MEAISKYILWIHIFAGGIALLSGIVPMVSKKGGKLHTQTGKIHFWAMFVIFITALLRFKPEIKLIFLDCIAIFSFYNTFTGMRLIQMKTGITPKLIDWIACYTALFFSFLMLGIAVWAVIHQIVFLWATLGLFGLICLRLSFTDWQLFTGRTQPEKMHWFLNHIARMVGSYIATFTAFVVVNNKGFVPELVGWITPAVIGVIGIIRWRAYYRAKFTPKVELDLAATE
jgi:hypothetical protein